MEKITELSIFYPNHQVMSWKVGENCVTLIEDCNDLKEPPVFVIQAKRDGKEVRLVFNTGEALGYGVTVD